MLTDRLRRGSCFEQMTVLTELHSLSLLDCQSLMDAGLIAIAQLPALATLTLDECELLTDDGTHAFTMRLCT